MNKYELCIIFKPSLDEELLKTEFDKAIEYIERFGGIVDKVDNWGKRKLAYEIDKITEGYYYFVTFQAEGGMPKELEQRIRIMESVLRYLITRQDVK